MYLPPFKSQSKLEIIGKLGPKIACRLKNTYSILEKIIWKERIKALKGEKLASYFCKGQ